MKSPNAIAVVQDALVRQRDFELEFLPAAEIVETPASPAGRAIGATVILVFCVALAWASWSTVDIGQDNPKRPHQGGAAI
jgi:hemolysin D